MAADNLAVRPLTTGHAGTVAKMNAMTPKSGTNLLAGLQFGWRVLSEQLPFDQAAPYNSGVIKIMVLFSDGRHNRDDWGAFMDVLEHHIGRILDEHDIPDFDEFSGLIGPDWAMTLWVVLSRTF